MKKLFAAALILCLAMQIFGQKSEKVEVLTLGSFHFAFPNQDLAKTAKEDQIDVLEPKYQKEIELIVKKMARFKPTIIVIERDADEQAQTDTDFANYLQGKYQLKRDETEQIAFRLAKSTGIKKLYCVNAWGDDYSGVSKIIDDKTNPERQKIIDEINKNNESNKSIYENTLFKKEGISAELKRLNSPEYQRRDLGTYLVGIFKYENAENKYFGPDFVTGWWFNRNLRISRNIQKINAKPIDRIFVLFGAGHMNLLNLFFESSPEYKLLKANDFLK